MLSAPNRLCSADAHHLRDDWSVGPHNHRPTATASQPLLRSHCFAATASQPLPRSRCPAATAPQSSSKVSGSRRSAADRAHFDRHDALLGQLDAVHQSYVGAAATAGPDPERGMMMMGGGLDGSSHFEPDTALGAAASGPSEFGGGGGGGGGAGFGFGFGGSFGPGESAGHGGGLGVSAMAGLDTSIMDQLMAAPDNAVQAEPAGMDGLNLGGGGANGDR